MQLQELIDHLQKLVKENPSYGNLTVIYAKDDEGNGYQKVNFYPAVVQAVDINEYFIDEIYHQDEQEEYETGYAQIYEPNAILIN